MAAINDSGIKALVVLNAATASSASQEANEAAEKGQELLLKRKQLRGAESYFERAVGNNTIDPGEREALAQMSAELSANGIDVTNFDEAGVTGTSIDASSEDKNARDNVGKVETMRKSFENANKSLDDQGRIDNFQQQQLLATYNEEAQKASGSQKKLDGVDDAIIRSIAG